MVLRKNSRLPVFWSGTSSPTSLLLSCSSFSWLFPIPWPLQWCSSYSFSFFCPDPVPLDFCMIGSLFDSQLKCQFLRKNFCNQFLLSHSLACHFVWYFFIAPCFCSVAKSCPILCDPIDCSMPGFPVLHYLPEFSETHVHWVGDTT